MADWYYYNTNGEKVGPIRGKELKRLAREGTVMPETKIEDGAGHAAFAKNVTGLMFSAQESSVTIPLKQDAILKAEHLGEQDFARLGEDFERLQKQQEFQHSTKNVVSPDSLKPVIFAESVLNNQFTASAITTNRKTPISFATPADGRKNTRWLVASIVILLVTAGITWTVVSNSEKIRRDRQLNEIVKAGIIKDVIAGLPFEFTEISINLTHKSADSASAKFFAKMCPTESLYGPISITNSLRKLGIIDLYEEEFAVAKSKFQRLPALLQADVRSALPEDLSQSRFYDILVPKGEEITLTGSVELAKSEKSWQIVKYLVDPFSCGDKFTPESKLQVREYKLDSASTKQTVNTIIQKRKDFVSKVDSAVTKMEQEQRAVQEAAVRGDPDAQYELGILYHLGHYVSKDMAKAEEWLRNAADQGNRKATEYLSKYFGIDIKQQPNAEEMEPTPPKDERTKILAGALDLRNELIKSGFGVVNGQRDIFNNLEKFVFWGNDYLKGKMDVAMQNRQNVNKFDDVAIANADAIIQNVQSQIMAAQEEIAQKTFLCEYPYQVSDAKNYGNGVSSFTMWIRTGFNDRNPKVNPSFCVPNVVVSTGTSDQGGITLSIRGNTNNIGELVEGKDNYQARIRFTNLRYKKSFLAAAEADVLKIEIVMVK